MEGVQVEVVQLQVVLLAAEAAEWKEDQLVAVAVEVRGCLEVDWVEVVVGHCDQTDVPLEEVVADQSEQKHEVEL